MEIYGFSPLSFQDTESWKNSAFAACRGRKTSLIEEVCADGSIVTREVPVGLILKGVMAQYRSLLWTQFVADSATTTKDRESFDFWLFCRRAEAAQERAYLARKSKRAVKAAALKAEGIIDRTYKGRTYEVSTRGLSWASVRAAQKAAKKAAKNFGFSVSENSFTHLPSEGRELTAGGTPATCAEVAPQCYWAALRSLKREFSETPIEDLPFLGLVPPVLPQRNGDLVRKLRASLRAAQAARIAAAPLPHSEGTGPKKATSVVFTPTFCTPTCEFMGDFIEPKNSIIRGIISRYPTSGRPVREILEYISLSAGPRYATSIETPHLDSGFLSRVLDLAISPGEDIDKCVAIKCILENDFSYKEESDMGDVLLSLKSKFRGTENSSTTRGFISGALYGAGVCVVTSAWKFLDATLHASQIGDQISKILDYIQSGLAWISSSYAAVASFFQKAKDYIVECLDMVKAKLPPYLFNAEVGRYVLILLGIFLCLGLVNSVIYSVAPQYALSFGTVCKLSLGALALVGLGDLTAYFFNGSGEKLRAFVNIICNVCGCKNFFSPSGDAEEKSAFSVLSLVGAIMGLQTLLPTNLSKFSWDCGKWAQTFKTGFDCHEKFSAACESMSVWLLSKVGLFKEHESQSMQTILLSSGINTAAWIEQVAQLHLDVHRSTLDISNLLLRARGLIDTGDKLNDILQNSTVPLSFLLRERLKLAHKNLLEDHAQLQLAIDVSVKNNCPFVLFFAGESGVGKSTVMSKFRDDVLDQLGYPRLGRFFPRNPGEKYWSGYLRHTAIVYDDFAQVPQSDNVYDEAELIRIVTNSVVTVPMAIAEEKGRTFRSKFIFACTNRYCESEDVPLADYYAFRRRRHLYICVERKPNTEPGPSGVDNLLFSEMDNAESNGEPKREMIGGKMQSVNQKMTYAQLRQLYLDRFAAFELLEQQLEGTPRANPEQYANCDSWWSLCNPVEPYEACWFNGEPVSDVDQTRCLSTYKPRMEILRARAILEGIDFADIDFIVKNCSRTPDSKLFHPEEEVRLTAMRHFNKMSTFTQRLIISSIKQEELNKSTSESCITKFKALLTIPIDAWKKAPTWFKCLSLLLVVGGVGYSLTKMISAIIGIFRKGPAAASLALLGGGIGAVLRGDSPDDPREERDNPDRIVMKGRGKAIWAGLDIPEALEAIRKSQVTLMGQSKNGGPTLCSALPLSSHAILCTTHEIEAFDLNQNVSLIINNSIYSFVLVPGCVKYKRYNQANLADKVHELVRVELPSGKGFSLNARAQFSEDFYDNGTAMKCWVVPNKNPAVPDVMRKVTCEKSNQIIDIFASELSRSGGCEPVRQSQRFIYADGPARNGHCGRLLCAEISGHWRVIGMCAGEGRDLTGTTKALYADIPSEFLKVENPKAVHRGAEINESILDRFQISINMDERVLTPMTKSLGRVSGQFPRALRKTSIVPSLISEHLWRKPETEPTVLGKMDTRTPYPYDPYSSISDKFVEEVGPIDLSAGSDASLVVANIGSSWKSAAKIQCATVLTWDIAINGDPTIPYCERLPMSTSEGYPDTVARTFGEKGKKRFFDMDGGSTYVPTPALLQELEILEGELQKEEVHLTCINTACAKDEKTSSKKVRVTPKTRIFEILPFQINIIIRRYFMFWMQLLMAAHDCLPSKVGINVYSESWDILLGRHTRLANHFTGDYSGFDTSTPRVLVYAIIDKVNELANDSEVNQRTRRNLIRFVLNRYLISDGFVYEIHGGTPSGFAPTVIINSVVNEFYLKWSWMGLMKEAGYAQSATLYAFHEATEISLYGDDNFVSVATPVASIYNLKTISDFLSRVGVKLGDGAKSGTIKPFIPLEEVDFLKRQFVADSRSTAILCPLKKLSIEERLFYVKGGQDELAALELNIATALCEAFFHGDRYFIELERRIIKAVQSSQIHLTRPLPTMESIRVWYLSQRSNTKVRSPSYEGLGTMSGILAVGLSEVKNVGGISVFSGAGFQGRMDEHLKVVPTYTPGGWRTSKGQTQMSFVRDAIKMANMIKNLGKFKCVVGTDKSMAYIIAICLAFRDQEISRLEVRCHVQLLKVEDALLCNNICNNLV
uniref:Polyprotein n=1 Tax=Citrus mosaic sadwavirus TaxID=57325 RepID=A0A2Z4Q2Z6_SDV|nr:polyprotein [Citrus mosaic sadwavirus]